VRTLSRYGRHLGNEDEKRGLCHTCFHSTVIVDEQYNRTIVCGVLPTGKDHIQKPIISCSEYKDKSFKRRRELEEIAWILDPNKRIIGFVAPGTQEHYRLKKKDQGLDDY
jgi:hypothetical protein